MFSNYSIYLNLLQIDLLGNVPTSDPNGPIAIPSDNMSALLGQTPTQSSRRARPNPSGTQLAATSRLSQGITSRGDRRATPAAHTARITPLPTPSCARSRALGAGAHLCCTHAHPPRGIDAGQAHTDTRRRYSTPSATAPG